MGSGFSRSGTYSRGGYGGAGEVKVRMVYLLGTVYGLYVVNVYLKSSFGRFLESDAKHFCLL